MKKKSLKSHEKSSEAYIKINKNFRIICTSYFSKINQISPAFINRFVVKVLEDQLPNIKEADKMKEIIKMNQLMILL